MCGEDKSCGCNAAQQAAHNQDGGYPRTPTPEDLAQLEAGGKSASITFRPPQATKQATPDVEAITASVAVAEPEIAQTEATDVLIADASDPTTGLPTQWHAVLTVEGLRTTDHRAIAPGALSWRQLPLAIFAQFLNAGHGDAPIVGSITSITRMDVAYGTLILAEGTFDLTTDAGQQAARMCANQTLRWGSIDLEVLESQYIEVSVGGGGGDLMDILFGDDTDDGGDDWYEEVTLGRIMGFTMVATPAFPQAVIAPIDVELDIPDPMGSPVPMVGQGLMASAVPALPPSSWFRNPELQEPTALTITDDGQLYGHLALWNTCHTGFQDACVVPPHSEQDYAYFQTGRVKCEGGDQVRVGQITFDTGHASSTMGWRDTTAHYDNTGSAAADVAVGEDEHGIWFAGALRPGLSDDTLRAVRASALSGDWRKIGGGLELVAALCVNVPGFPIVASLAPALVAAGVKKHEQISLITAGLRPRNPVEVLARRVATMERALKPLMTLRRDQLAKRVNLDAAQPAEDRKVISIEELRERVNLGGAPSKGTPADKRLKKNKNKVAS